MTRKWLPPKLPTRHFSGRIEFVQKEEANLYDAKRHPELRDLSRARSVEFNANPHAILGQKFNAARF